ncbi:MAG: FIST N-terminal domain-containing protein [Myxococcota bacterium]
MQWVAHTALEDDLAAACRSCLSAVRAQLEGAPDLVFAFVSPALDDETARTLAEAFPDAHVLGCAAGGVVGGDTEVEGRSAVSLTAARLPGTHIEIQARTRARGSARGSAPPGRPRPRRSRPEPRGGSPRSEGRRPRRAPPRPG